MTVAVVGAGIAGLAAAHELVASGVEVVVLEAGDRAGGKIRTTPFGGTPVEEGPDAFLARRPEAVGLCDELGLRDQLVAPATGAAWLWTRGALQPIPQGTVLGVPTGAGWWRSTGAVSWPGKLRSGLDGVLPGRAVRGDTSIGELVSRRFGREVADRLVDPLLGGINAGRIDRLSLDASAPQIAAAARKGGSLGRALRAASPSPAAGTGAPAPVFFTVRGGLSRLVEALTARLADAGSDVRTGSDAVELRRGSTGWVVVTQQEELEVDGVVLASPAFASADLLEAVAPDAAGALRSIDYASVALATARFARSDVAFPDGSGFLVPRVDGRLLSAGTWYSAKWPHVADDDSVLMRLSAGKVGDDRAIELDDAELVTRLLDELGQATGCEAAPSEVRVTRWPRSFPQYDVGHLDLVAGIERALPEGLAVAGAALHGVGIPACIGSGRTAATRLLASTQVGRQP